MDEENHMKPNKYHQGKICAIRNNKDDDVYIGSTTQQLSKRFNDHKKNLLTSKCENYRIYQKMRELGENSFYVELVENCPCETKEELRRREGQVIREQGTLNSQIAGRTNKEYYDDNVETLRQNKREYHQNNKDKITQYQENNKEYIKERAQKYYEKNKEHLNEVSREYRKANPEYFRQKKVEYREKHKGAIRQRAMEKKECPNCGVFVRKGGMNRHMKTDKCKTCTKEITENTTFATLYRIMHQ